MKPGERDKALIEQYLATPVLSPAQPLQAAVRRLRDERDALLGGRELAAKRSAEWMSLGHQLLRLAAAVARSGDGELARELVDALDNARTYVDRLSLRMAVLEGEAETLRERLGYVEDAEAHPEGRR